MYKSLFISLNIVGMLMVPLLYVGDVSITQSGSSQVAAGDEIEVTIAITKEGVAGPARLKLDLTNAQGIEIEDIETEGASFSFNETSALFIWYSIQPTDQITLKYRVIADASASGSKTITGSFSYLDEDERKKKDIQPFNFTISGDGAIASTTTEDPVVDESGEETETVEAVTPPESTNTEDTSSSTTTNEEEENNTSIASSEEPENTETETDNTPDPIVLEGEEENETVEAVATNTPSSNESSTNSSTPPGDVKCTRSIQKQGENFIVSVNINKGINGGFARVKEEIPAGFKAEKVEAAGSIFKFADNSAKFLWSQIPRNVEQLTVKYRLIPTENVSGTYSIRGSFSAEFLIEDDKPKKIRIATSTIDVDGGIIADNSDNNSNNTTSNNSSNNQSYDNTTGATTSATSISSTSNTNGVKYRVQIIAAHNTVSKRYIKKAFGYSGSVNLENHEGWVKYTTNGYNTYKDARDKRNSLNNYDFDGPFVTAYNNGDRITVQEALMISNQSWIQ
ncbi:MAG: hypothetical protein N4A35_01080 [Flavobacteriales bacterium]|jgi:hypothetical protein|nr:hypothetical protein [Flavobacteriales bacterium]